MRGKERKETLWFRSIDAFLEMWQTHKPVCRDLNNQTSIYKPFKIAFFSSISFFDFITFWNKKRYIKRASNVSILFFLTNVFNRLAKYTHTLILNHSTHFTIHLFSIYHLLFVFYLSSFFCYLHLTHFLDTMLKRQTFKQSMFLSVIVIVESGFVNNFLSRSYDFARLRRIDYFIKDLFTFMRTSPESLKIKIDRTFFCLGANQSVFFCAFFLNSLYLTKWPIKSFSRR